MKVVLFRPFRDAYRFSMNGYADAIEQHVRPCLDPPDSIVSEELPDARREGWRRYWDQYVRYEAFARRRAGDVNHIVDHGYGHLTRSLPPGRTIVSFHDAVVTKVPGASWGTRVSFRRSLRALPRAAAIVCDSHAAKADLHELVEIPPERVHVIPLGIDEMFRPASDRADIRRRLGFAGPVVLMVGHTQAYMNVERMLTSFATLAGRGPLAGVELVKIGLPFSPAQMSLLADLDLQDRVRMVGRVDQAALPAYFQAADALLYAPLLAGFGLPPLEAMACGTPVVASRRGSIPEVTGEAALLVEADDTGEIASALAEVLTNEPTRRRLITAGLEQAGRFAWSDAGRRFAALYRAVADA